MDKPIKIDNFWLVTNKIIKYVTETKRNPDVSLAATVIRVRLIWDLASSPASHEDTMRLNNRRKNHVCMYRMIVVLLLLGVLVALVLLGSCGTVVLLYYPIK